MVWVDQPIGTGLSSAASGAPAQIKNETDVARDFAAFWKNFIETFKYVHLFLPISPDVSDQASSLLHANLVSSMTGYKVYLTGESYAGQYIPYIAQYMLEQNNTDYYNVKGIQINDPSIGDDAVLIYAPAVTHMNDYLPVFGLNETFVADVNQRAESCGYFSFMEEALTFPPKGKFTAPNSTAEGCAVWDDIVTAALYVNPCFNFYHLTDFCPFLWDEMGFPSLALGPNNYFNRSDVQEQLHVTANYAVCGDDTLGLLTPGDTSPPSSYDALPYVIERTNNVIVGSGLLDYLLLMNGTLATLNNMTWNGAQGFSSAPSGKFFVPYNPDLGIVLYETLDQPPNSMQVGLVAGGGTLGTTHTERGLTWVTVDLAGHEIPQYVPGAAYRQLEFLLGRIDSLTQIDDSFTTQTGNYSGTTPAQPDYSDSGAQSANATNNDTAKAEAVVLPRRMARSWPLW